MPTCAVVGPKYQRLCEGQQPQLHYSKTSYVETVSYFSITVILNITVYIDNVRAEKSILTGFRKNSVHPGGNIEQQEWRVEAGDNMADQEAEKEGVGKGVVNNL